VLSSMQNLLLLPEDQIIGMDDYPQMVPMLSNPEP